VDDLAGEHALGGGLVRAFHRRLARRSRSDRHGPANLDLGDRDGRPVDVRGGTLSGARRNPLRPALAVRLGHRPARLARVERRQKRRASRFLRHRLPGPVDRRSLLPVLRQPGLEARALAELRGGVLPRARPDSPRPRRLPDRFSRSHPVRQREPARGKRRPRADGRCRGFGLLLGAFVTRICGPWTR
jgi:hypothetical protein